MHAIGQSGRHIFWLANPPVQQPPVDLSYGLGEAAPVQLPAQGHVEPASRLDGLSIAAIQNRILINPAVKRFIAAKAAYDTRSRAWHAPDVYTDKALIADFGVSLPSLTPNEEAMLTAINVDPTSAEIADLAMIDGFFRNVDSSQEVNAQFRHSLTREVCTALNPQAYQDFGGGRWQRKGTPGGAIAAWLTYFPDSRWSSTHPINATQDEIDAIKNSKFFCETPLAWPDPSGIRIDWPSWFGIDQNQTWGTIKLQVKNTVKMMNGIFSYPFPPPLDMYIFQYWTTVRAEMQSFVKGGPIEPEGFRYWITISVLTNYDGMVSRIQADLRHKRKKARRKMLMKAIGIAIAGIIAPYLLPALVVAAAVLIKAAIDTYMTLQAQKQAAKEIAAAGKMFEADAPAFATEVNKLSDMMDSQAAQAEAAIPLPPDLIEELGPTPPKPQPLLFGTGVAAAIGLTVLAIFKK